jgi:hypothetical protein
MNLRFAMVLALVAAAPVRADEPAPVTVPFEMLESGKLISGHLAIKAKVNGKGPYRFVFDTGAPVVLLSVRVGKEAGLIGDKRAKQTGTDGTKSMMPGQVRIQKLEVGTLAAEDIQAIVFDHPTVKAIAEVFGPIDGIVGFPFFARFRTAIDYQSKTLTFTPNGYQPGDVLQKLMATLLKPRRASDGPRIVGGQGLWGMRIEKGDGDNDAGVMVADVLAGGPAAKAGIKSGDRLLTLDGRWTDTVIDCYHAAAAVKAGSPAECELSRDGKPLKLTVTPAAGL